MVMRGCTGIDKVTGWVDMMTKINSSDYYNYGEYNNIRQTHSHVYFILVGGNEKRPSNIFLLLLLQLTLIDGWEYESVL